MAKILIIDDSWLIRKTVSGILKSHGYEYAEASGGKEGICQVIEYKPDCIILDLLMPDMDGLDVIEEIRKKNITTPIIILSADIQETTRKKCDSAGAFDFIQKPPKEEIVTYKIKKALENRKCT